MTTSMALPSWWLPRMINALKIVKKQIGDVKVVINGAGAAGIAIGKHLLNLGVKHLTMVRSLRHHLQGHARSELRPC